MGSLKQILVLLIIILLIIDGCSSAKRDAGKRENSFVQSEEIIDSTKVKATLKPIGYEWNTEGNLVDLRTSKLTNYGKLPYPNPFCPPTLLPFLFDNQKSGIYKIVFCNYDESSCLKIEEKYIEEGEYGIGFQKLDVIAGYYLINIYGPDGFIEQKTINVLY